MCFAEAIMDALTAVLVTLDGIMATGFQMKESTLRTRNYFSVRATERRNQTAMTSSSLFKGNLPKNTRINFELEFFCSHPQLKSMD